MRREISTYGIAGILALLVGLYAGHGVAFWMIASGLRLEWGWIVAAILWPLPVAAIGYLCYRAIEVFLLVYSLPATLFRWPEVEIKLTIRRKENEG